MSFQHKNLAAGEWCCLSLVEQMGNIGSEINRAVRWQNKDEKLFGGAVIRALELLDLTIGDPRWKNRLKEPIRVRELICDVVFGGKKYETSLEDLNLYFFNFAVASRAHK